MSAAAKTPMRSRARKLGTPVAETILLADLTITWRRRRRYALEPEDGVDLTITGAQLAAVLGTLAEEEPQGQWDTLGDPKDIAETLEYLNEVLFGLSIAADLDTSDALAWLTRYVRGLVAGLRGHKERELILKGATVTITKPAEVAP